LVQKNSPSAAGSATTTTTTTTTITTATGRQHVEPNTDYRVVVFGSAGVGKSSLVVRFVKGTFKDTYVPTIEDNYRQIISNNKLVFTLQITDTTGSHQFPAMQRLNIQKGHAFILVYSITSRQSLDELKSIYKDIVEIKGAAGLKTVPMMLVGNKCDESASRDVQTAAVERLALDWGCAFMEVSRAAVNLFFCRLMFSKMDTLCYFYHSRY
jgi:DIRAS family GTP-binding Ras-like protein 2